VLDCSAGHDIDDKGQHAYADQQQTGLRCVSRLHRAHRQAAIGDELALRQEGPA